jgi:hypothetical protein
MHQDVDSVPLTMQLLRERLHRLIMRKVSGVAARGDLGIADATRCGFQRCRGPAHQAQCCPLGSEGVSDGLPHSTAGPCDHRNMSVQ